MLKRFKFRLFLLLLCIFELSLTAAPLHLPSLPGFDSQYSLSFAAEPLLLISHLSVSLDPLCFKVGF